MYSSFIILLVPVHFATPLPTLSLLLIAWINPTAQMPRLSCVFPCCMKTSLLSSPSPPAQIQTDSLYYHSTLWWLLPKFPFLCFTFNSPSLDYRFLVEGKSVHRALGAETRTVGIKQCLLSEIRFSVKLLEQRASIVTPKQCPWAVKDQGETCQAGAREQPGVQYGLSSQNGASDVAGIAETMAVK